MPKVHMIGPDGSEQDVDLDQVDKFTKLGASRAVLMRSKDGNESKWVPDSMVATIKARGGTVDPHPERPLSDPDRGNSIVDEIRQGALGGLQLPRSMNDLQGMGDTVTKRVHDIYDAFSEGRWGHGLLATGQLIGDPMGVNDGIVATVKDQLSKAVRAVKQGRYQDAIGHTGASIVQPLTPTADASEDIQSGHPVRGGVQAATNIISLGLLGNAAYRGAPEAAAQAARDYARGKAATVAPRMVKLLQPLGDGAKAIGEYQTALPLIQAEEKTLGKPLDINNTQQAVDIAKKKLYAQRDAYLDQAESHGVTIPTDNMNKAIKGAVSDKVRAEHPTIAASWDKIADDAYPIGNAASPSQYISRLRTTNDQLAPFYNKLAPAQATDLGAHLQQSVLNAQGKVFRNDLYKAIDKDGNGVNAAELQKRIGSLKAFNEDFVRFNDKVIKRPEDLSPNASPADLVEGLLSPQKVAFTKAMKLAFPETKESANAKLTQLYQDHAGADPLPAVPAASAPKPFDLTASPGEPKFQTQRALFGNEADAYDTVYPPEANPSNSIMLKPNAIGPLPVQDLLFPPK